MPRRDTQTGRIGHSHSMPSGPFRLGGAQPSPAEQHEQEPTFRLMVGEQAVPVDPGESIIGRGEECRIVVMHSAVSRNHARLVLDGARLTIEDLDSANGTYVNRVRIYGPESLERGDWIALGGFEIEVLQRVSLDPDSEHENPPTPSSGVKVLAQIPLSKSADSFRIAETTRVLRAPIAGSAQFESAARLADRVLALGRSEAAAEILADPIANVLAAALSGSIPDSETVDSLGRSALKLANATHDGAWVDAAIEVHLLAARPLRLETLRQLVLLRARTGIGDDDLLTRYYETLRSQMGSMSRGEQTLVALVADLVPGLERTR